MVEASENVRKALTSSLQPLSLGSHVQTEKLLTLFPTTQDLVSPVRPLVRCFAVSCDNAQVNHGRGGVSRPALGHRLDGVHVNGREPTLSET